MSDDWDPETVDLRNPGEAAETAHAERMLEQIREGVGDGTLAVKDYRAAVNEVTDSGTPSEQDGGDA